MPWWWPSLRTRCYFIGYMNLVATFLDLVFHFSIVGLVTSWFQCDVSSEALNALQIPFLTPLLLIANIGTHGYYPYPLFLPDGDNLFGLTAPKSYNCYPGMFHLKFSDVINFTINLIWFKFGKSFVVGLHKKNPESVRVFLGLNLIKLILQVIYFSYEMPGFRSGVPASDLYWLLKLVDILLTAVVLLTIHEYLKVIRRKIAKKIEQPPPYVECLIKGTPKEIKPKKEEKKDVEVAIPEEKKVEVEATSITVKV